MIRITLYQNKNQKIGECYGKWYPRVVADETIGLDELAGHMASHNTPFSKGAIKGILTDAVVCTKELLLLGKNVKFPDLAIFSIGLRLKEGGGAATKEEFSVSKFIKGLRLRARATGELSMSNIDAAIKRVDYERRSDTDGAGGSSPDTGGTSPTTPGGSSSGTGGSSSDTGGSSQPGGDEGDGD